MHVVIFEGKYWRTFAPLSLSRPLFSLVTGMSSLLEKQVRHLSPSRVTMWVRPELAEQCRRRIVPALGVPAAVNQPLDDEPALITSGRMLYFNRFETPDRPAVCSDEDGLVQSAFARSPGLGPEDVMGRSGKWLQLLDLPQMMPQGRLVQSLWDLIHWNEESLLADSAAMRERRSAEALADEDTPYHLVNAEEVYLGPQVKLEPGCVLDASRGPVMVDEGASIGANAVLYGPCYIGRYSQVRAVSLIRPGTSVGMMCRVGGEISNSIILGYTNKAHDGYLGDSYIGRWCNLGAGTTTSNLKNTYGEITVKMGDREVPTGRRHLGSIVGDHTKTAIATRLMTGTYIGFCCQLAGSAHAPRFIPSYSYWTDRGMEAYRLEKAIEVTRHVFARRDRPWTDIDEQIMRYVQSVAPEVEGTGG